LAKGFSEIIFHAINEERFAVLYSDYKASRPNTPVNAIIGSLILKELFSLTDDELLASILCDVRFQYALHTTSFKEQPFSDQLLAVSEKDYTYTNLRLVQIFFMKKWKLWLIFLSNILILTHQ